MSGLYNVMFGEQPEGELLVALLQEVQPFSVGRYRDGWVETHGDVPMIRIHTRNGGGNRECYDCRDTHSEGCLALAIESMQAHPWYVRDEDDDFDSTYADFYFKPQGPMGDDMLPALIRIAQPAVDMGERWQQAIDAIGKP